ncbi:probable DNA helicase MCM9 [Aedes aegypti]|uniref:DNA helicase n=1 Tax=Aedes aegypti TaxID=7159 RepID=A0A1S4FIN1_AEDAE|nr:probable DNA helicase MCM9 [Aedes aegypti]
MEDYLKQYYDEEITNLLNNPDDMVYVSINVNLAHLQRKQPALYNSLLRNYRSEWIKWNTCLLNAQKSLVEGNMFLEPGFQIKQNCHVRFVNMPQTVAEAVRKVAFPNNDNVGQFVQVKGSVIRMTQARFLEFKKEYTCSRCKNDFTLEAQYEKSYVFDPPRACPLAGETGCKGTPHQKSAQPQPDHCRDYQEIRIQEIMSERNVPASLLVTLENDLVDNCQPGDCVTVVGIIERRWSPLVQGKRTEVTIAMNANSVSKDENKMNLGKDLPEHLVFVRGEWQNTVKEIGELAARDMLVQSFCPEIHGMYPVKLAVALSLASCTERFLGSGASVRGHSHLLLVGDPGLAKSRLLKFASEVSVRSVFTTGMGCSAAGLTAAAVKEDGEWQLEAGALVLADGGVCCIDEFNLMRESDKASIHEAMEQQTISMAKAGLVCKLSTRCVVLAATNPKNLLSMVEMEANSSASLGIGGPLLSRFDLVLILTDDRNEHWDERVANHILALSVVDETRDKFEETTPDGHWDLERLQTHFLAIKDIHPRITDDANTILGAYYKLCRSDPSRDPSRTTVRLLDSLVRLSQAHARLLFRDEVNPVDAITVIRLMESTWGFGKVLQPTDLIRKGLPIGPTPQEIAELLEQLLLSDVVKDIQLEQVNKGRVERYQQELAKKKKEATPANKWESLSTQRIIEFDERVLSALENNQSESSKQKEVIEEPNSEEPKQKPIEERELYSKYSFTQMRKNNVKKLRKESSEKTVDPKPPEPAKKSKTKKPFPEPDPKLKENMNNDQLDRIFSSIRQNFMSELSGATQQTKTNEGSQECVTRSSQIDTNFPPASGRSRVSREESFRTMLDVSGLLDDDPPEERQPVNPKTTNSSMSVFENLDSSTTPVQSIDNPTHSLLTKPLVNTSDDESRFRLKRPRNEIKPASHNESTSSTVSRFQFKRPAPNSTPCSPKPSNSTTSSADDESRYRLKRPAPKTQTNASNKPTTPNPMLVSQLSFDMSFDTEALALEEAPQQPKPKPSLSEQTLNKMRVFEFNRGPDDGASNSKADPEEKKQRDDSAYESQPASSSSASTSGSGRYWKRDLKLPELSHVATLGGSGDVDAELALLESVDF